MGRSGQSRRGDMRLKEERESMPGGWRRHFFRQREHKQRLPGRKEMNPSESVTEGQGHLEASELADRQG